MKIFLAIAMMAALAAPVQAQTPAKQSPFAATAVAALHEMKRRCSELAAPYKGGMLQGKIAIDEEEITPQMMADETYPTDAQATALRGYMANYYPKCEAVQRDFVTNYTPFELTNLDFVVDREKPVFAALIAKEITYGMANRDFKAIETELAARRKTTLPQAARASDSTGRPAGAGPIAEAVRNPCAAAYAQVDASLLKGKLVVVGDMRLTPEMLADRTRPSDADVAVLKAYWAAGRKCSDLAAAFTKTYIDWYLPVVTFERDQYMAVYAALIAQRITYGEANKKFVEIGKAVDAKARSVIAEHGGQKSAGTASAAPPQPQAGAASSQMQAANQDVLQRCAILINPFRTGILKSKIPFADHQITPAMLADLSGPSDQEAESLTDYIGARQLCAAYDSRYLQAFQPWLKPVIDRAIGGQLIVLHALAAKEMTYAEANAKLADIQDKGLAEEKAAIDGLATGGNAAGDAAPATAMSLFESLQPNFGQVR